jgi:hypothetical protein
MNLWHKENTSHESLGTEDGRRLEGPHVVGIKAEFEAEGTRLEEALRLKEVCMKAGLGLTIKIGGCEALRDMYECKVIGVERVVAPMVESAYALHKYLAATKLAFPPDDRDQIAFFINIETIQCWPFRKSACSTASCWAGWTSPVRWG